MRKFALILCILIAFSACAMGSASASAEELTVFNWFDYIDPAVIDLFEDETGITVKYVNFTTNEEMYTKLEAGAGTYDVIFPSEYMIERMIAHDMLEELDLSAMPNFANVMDRLKDPSYDPGNKYSVPYMWGTLGYLYNSEMVDEELTSWSALFDEKYAGNVIMMNSMRDSIGLALKYLGYSMNTRSEAELNEAKDLLIKQKQDKIQCGYLLDETKDKMVGGEAAIGVDVYHADVVILDVMDEVVADQVLELCRTLRKGNSGICLLLLVRQDQSKVRTMAVKAKQAGIADDFVFYDSSLAYLFAKLAAL